jgi:hypothetical protein
VRWSDCLEISRIHSWKNTYRQAHWDKG